MRLANFIRSNREPILAEWESFARSMLPEAKARVLSTGDFRDHGSELLDAIAEDMDASQTPSEQTEKSRGRGCNGVRLDRVGDLHGGTRIESGFDLEQVVAEFRALRASVIRLWERSSPEGAGAADDGGITRFHEAIDQGLSQSINQSAKLLASYRNLFVGILGHDLRNPLAAIVLCAGALLQSEHSPAGVAKSGAQILKSANNMRRMVGDLLDLTRTRFGKTIPVKLERLDLAAVCKSAVEEIAAGRPARIIRCSTSGDLHGCWDEARLHQLVSNLVSNACEHGAAATPILVDVSADASQVFVSVHNEGEEIAAADLPTLFDPLVQGQRKQTEEHRPSGHASLGLGLYIVKQIATAHGGTVEVSTSNAAGTTFRVSMPRDGASL